MVQHSKDMASGIQAVIFRLHNKQFGVEVVYIREITRMMDVTVINEPTGFIKGVVNYQGQVIVVVDLATPLGLSLKEEIPEMARMIFIELRKKVFGFIVDQVFDVIHLPANTIKGTCPVDGKSIVILDLENIFSKLL